MEIREMAKLLTEIKKEVLIDREFYQDEAHKKEKVGLSQLAGWMLTEMNDLELNIERAICALNNIKYLEEEYDNQLKRNRDKSN